ncbi:hypothetical protein DYB36_004105 [Aphanomyces astaci]|uniref:Fe2OG dioxygenase domain-containing protein n=1 Tax=Aphanomyces astaci TaxID=112090 RepID=A0A397A6H0_APHAT|nr:hypothetical protein DYB36_004105 [Aphanomyces astaci]
MAPLKASAIGPGVLGVDRSSDLEVARGTGTDVARKIASMGSNVVVSATRVALPGINVRVTDKTLTVMSDNARRAEPHRGDGKGDPNLPAVNDDPRVGTVLPCTIKALKGNTGRNTESFDPASTLVRPSMRVVVGPKKRVFDKVLKHDDVVVVPDFFCAEDDWSIYYKLIEEMRSIQSAGQSKSEWIPWAEGCHLISQNPTGCPTYEDVLKRTGEYFNMKQGSQGTRFNWYRDSSDWKPFHHDSAAYNPHRARNQNITVGVSFGSERELSFLHAKNGSRIYFPQTNGMLFAFGRDVNINWKHGVNALANEHFSGKGRISIILWGLAQDVVEEPDSPPLLTNDARNGFDNSNHRSDQRGDRGRSSHIPFNDGTQPRRR